MNKYENAIQCLQVMKGAECINALSQEFPEHYGIENIEALELAIEVLKKNRWIPCGERLPEEEGRYLITIPDIGVVSSFYNKNHKLPWGGYETECVTAWQPLPEPYKVGDQE